MKGSTMVGSDGFIDPTGVDDDAVAVLMVDRAMSRIEQQVAYLIEIPDQDGLNRVVQWVLGKYGVDLQPLVDSDVVQLSNKAPG